MENQSEKPKTVDPDDIIGHISKYQFLLWTLACIIQVPSGINAVFSVFALAKPDYRCKSCLDYNYDYHNFTEDSDTKHEFYTTFYSYEDGKCGVEYDTCRIAPEAGYNSNLTGTDFTGYEELETCCYSPGEVCEREPMFTKNYSEPISCSEFIYDRSIYTETVVTEFDLVCGNSWLIDLASSLYFLGFGLGGIIASYFSDKYGRKPVLLIFSVLFFAAGISTAFVKNVYGFIVLRVLTGFFVNAAMISGYSLSVELIGAKYRGLFSVSFQYFFAFGEILLSGIAYFWRDWHAMQIVVALTAVPIQGVFLKMS